MSPFKAPAKQLIIRAIITANKIGIPFIQSTPIKIEVSPIIEPIDTSIPPVTITKVIGIAAIAINKKSFVLKGDY